MKPRTSLMVLLVVLALFAPSLGTVAAGSRPPDPGPPFDKAPRIAIISAYAPELEALKAQARIEKVVVLNGRSVYLGTLAKHKVLLTLSGVSMVNAAVTTQALVDHLRVERIVFSGIAGSVALDRCSPDGVCLDKTPVVRPGGSGVSGPTFVDNAAYRGYAWATWHADALDMESAAVAHVATVNGVPFILFRSLSDLACGGPGENEMDTFFQLAVNNSAKVMVAFLEAWPKR